MNATRQQEPASGFTLIELAISIALTSIMVMAGVALLMSQQRAFQSGSADRALQETGRVALESITSNLRLAGFGIDPAFTFDFGQQLGVPLSQGPAGASATTAQFNCPINVSCRDSISGPDELVFLYRDPAFYYPLAVGYTGGNTLTVTGPLRTPIRAGQILQVVCFAGNQYWAYVTVADDVPAAPTAISVPITISTPGGTNFPQQSGILADTCFNYAAPQGSSAVTVASAAKVYKVDRFRYFIGCYELNGTLRANAANCDAGARPYLMLDRGLSSGLEVITPDVEDLQLSYVFPASAANLQLIGATESAAIPASDQGLDLAPAAGIPVYTDASNAPTRTTQHPANIRAVRVSVVLRSPNFDATLNSATDTLIPAAGNRPGISGPIGYRRLLIETTAPIRNLEARMPYYPAYTAGTDQFNVGGG